MKTLTLQFILILLVMLSGCGYGNIKYEDPNGRKYEATVLTLAKDINLKNLDILWFLKISGYESDSQEVEVIAPIAYVKITDPNSN